MWFWNISSPISSLSFNYLKSEFLYKFAQKEQSILRIASISHIKPPSPSCTRQFLKKLCETVMLRSFYLYFTPIQFKLYIKFLDNHWQLPPNYLMHRNRPRTSNRVSVSYRHLSSIHKIHTNIQMNYSRSMVKDR